MSTAEIIALIAGLGGMATAAASYRRTNIDSKDSTVTGLVHLTDELRQELDREKVKRQELEAELSRTATTCQEQIAALVAKHDQEIAQMQATIYSQARRISQLEGGQR